MSGIAIALRAAAVGLARCHRSAPIAPTDARRSRHRRIAATAAGRRKSSELQLLFQRDRAGKASPRRTKRSAATCWTSCFAFSAIVSLPFAN